MDHNLSPSNSSPSDEIKRKLPSKSVLGPFYYTFIQMVSPKSTKVDAKDEAESLSVADVSSSSTNQPIEECEIEASAYIMEQQAKTITELYDRSEELAKNLTSINQEIKRLKEIETNFNSMTDQITKLSSAYNEIRHDQIASANEFTNNIDKIVAELNAKIEKLDKKQQEQLKKLSNETKENLELLKSVQKRQLELIMIESKQTNPPTNIDSEVMADLHNQLINQCDSLFNSKLASIEKHLLDVNRSAIANVSYRTEKQNLKDQLDNLPDDDERKIYINILLDENVRGAFKRDELTHIYQTVNNAMNDPQKTSELLDLIEAQPRHTKRSAVLGALISLAGLSVMALAATVLVGSVGISAPFAFPLLVTGFSLVAIGGAMTFAGGTHCANNMFKLFGSLEQKNNQRIKAQTACEAISNLNQQAPRMV